MLLKRCIDIVVSAFALLLLSPTLIAVAVLLWLDSGRPVLFRQRRVGLGFRQFDILKFRTMRVQAGGPAITVAGDARITRVGRFLRAAKLDEMPQFWNVLIGDMSLVGPRPEVPEYVEMFHDRYRHILTVRPGITDIASVRFRNEENLLAKGPEPLSEYVQRILPLKLDLADEYIRARSLQLDCLILLKTLLVTLVPHRGDLFLSIHLRIRKLTVAVESNEWLRRCLIWITHLGLFAISGVAAFSLRFDLHIPPSEIHHLWFALAVWLTIKPIVFRWLELDRGWWRFVSMDDLIRIAFGNFVGSVAGFIAIRFLGPSGFPRAIYFLDLFLCFLATSGIRASVRILREGREAARGQNEKRTLIYGAGNAGVILLREIRNNPKLPYRVVSFIDDRPDKQGLRISGVLVRGSGDDVKTLVERLGIQTILIAIPSATGLEMTRILRLCHAAGTE
jgi:lipopolysaccharide/colanic/teichoic acid biosynthesis glycosyltransferase